MADEKLKATSPKEEEYLQISLAKRSKERHNPKESATEIPTPIASEIHLFVSNITEEATEKDLITVLQAVQNQYGYLPKDSLVAVSNSLSIPLSKVYGVSTFYHQFRLEPSGMHVMQICKGTACHSRGHSENYEFLRLLLGLRGDEQTTKDGLFSLESARCFGCCSLAPVIMITSSDGSYKRLYGHVTSDKLRKILRGMWLHAGSSAT